jgi:TP901 family phage tail tape measure protein
MADKLIVELVLEAGDTKTAFNKVEGNAKKAGVSAGNNFANAFGSRVKGQLTGVVKQFAAIAAASVGFRAVANNVTEAVSSIRNFERALANVNSILPKNEKLTKQSIATFQDFAGTFGTSASRQADAFYSIVSAGIKGTSKQLKTLEVANQAAIAGLVDIDTASKALVSSVNSYAKSGLTAAEASDILFVAVREGQTTFGELAEFLGNAAPLAAAAGLKFEELAGAISGITKAGIKTDIAVTGIRALLTSLVKVTPEASKEAARLGLEFSTTALKSKGLVKFLKDVQTATRGNVESLGKLFPNVRALTPILQVVNGNFEDFARIQDEVKNSLNATSDAAEIVKKSLDFKLQQATANFALLRQEIVNGIVPALGEAAGALTRFLTLNRDSASATSKLNAEIGNNEAEIAKWSGVLMSQGNVALKEFDVNATFAQKKVFLLSQEVNRLKGNIVGLANQKELDDSPFEQLLQSGRELTDLEERLTAVQSGVVNLSETKGEFELLGDITEKKNEIDLLTASIEAMKASTVSIPEAIAPVSLAFESTLDVFKGVVDGFQSSITAVTDSTQQQIIQANEQIGKFSKKTGVALRSGVGQAAGGAFAQFGKALVSGENAVESFGKAFLQSIGQTLIQQGTAFILEGTAYAFSANPALQALAGGLISSGAAMAAFGGVLGASAGGGGASGGGGSSSGVSTDASGGEDLTSPEELERSEPNTNVEIVVQGSLVQQEELGTFITETLNESFGKQGVSLTDARFA